MFSNHAKTQSFEYHRNEVCHQILDALYFHAKPVIRENTFGKHYPLRFLLFVHLGTAMRAIIKIQIVA